MVERGGVRIGDDAPKRYLTYEETVADATGEGYGVAGFIDYRDKPQIQTDDIAGRGNGVATQPEQKHNDGSVVESGDISLGQTAVQPRFRELPYELRDNS